MLNIIGKLTFPFTVYDMHEYAIPMTQLFTDMITF